MSPYTPGPWAAFSGGDSAASNPLQAYHVAGPTRLYQDRSLGFTAEDAHLIAAAPDMLEVLQTLVATILEYERGMNLAPNPGRKYCWDCVERAVHVIAKAKGEPV